MPGWIAGSILLSSAYQAEQARDASREQMEFQSTSSDTAVQRRVKDLRAAGLNPILAGRDAASSMPGAQPQKFFEGESAARGYMEARVNRESAKLLKEQQSATADQATAHRAAARLADEQRRTSMFENVVRQAFIEHGTVDAEAVAARQEARRASQAADIERDLDESSGELFRTLRRLGVGGSTAAQILRGIGSASSGPGRGAPRGRR